VRRRGKRQSQTPARHLRLSLREAKIITPFWTESSRPRRYALDEETTSIRISFSAIFTRPLVLYHNAILLLNLRRHTRILDWYSTADTLASHLSSSATTSGESWLVEPLVVLPATGKYQVRMTHSRVKVLSCPDELVIYVRCRLEFHLNMTEPMCGFRTPFTLYDLRYSQRPKPRPPTILKYG